MEWITAVIVAPEAGVAFLGTQGDVWDAQKDMALAGLGALISMIVTACINRSYNRNFGREMEQSFRIKRKTPLGEVKIAEYERASRKRRAKR
jgi:putative membrane protein